MDTDEGNGAAVSATTAAEASTIAPPFEGGSTTPSTGVVLGINLLAINNNGGEGESPALRRAGEAHTPGGDSESVASGASRNMDESASEEGLCERGGGSSSSRRRAGSSSSRSAGSRRSRDRSNSDHSSSSSSGGSGRSTRQRRSGGGGGGRSRRDRDRSRDDGGRGSSLSPRQWERERERAGNGHGASTRNGSPSRRRERDRGDGSPRETPEPSKVLHVRNVGYPVVQVRVTRIHCMLVLRVRYVSERKKS